MAALKPIFAAAVANWQVSERWAFLPEVPKTSIGKFDKKLLRTRYAEGSLNVVVSDESPKAHAAT